MMIVLLSQRRKQIMPKEKVTNEIKDIVKFDIETAVIVALDAKYKDIQITDNKSKAIVMEGLAAYRNLRLAVVDGHKEEKEDALEYCNFLDLKKRQILARLAPGENQLKAKRQAYEDEIARVKAEKVRLEEERKENIQAEIHKIQEEAMPTILGTMALENLRELSSRLEDMEVKENKYMEFTEHAEKVLNDSYEAVQDAIAARIKLDKEAEERKAENARLEKARKKQEADQAVIDEANKAIKAAQKKIDDEKAKIEADKAKEARRVEKEAFEKFITEKAESAAAQKVKDDAAKKAEEEKVAEAEKVRKKALRPDREKLILFVGELMSITGPLDLTDKLAIEILDEFIPKIREIALEIKKQANELWMR